MYIQIGGYEISIFLFIAAGLIIVGICLFLWRKLAAKEIAGEFDKYKLITDWQRRNLVQLIDKDIEKYAEQEGPDYVQVANLISAYIKRKREWSRRELIEISPYAVGFLTTIISSEIMNCVKVHDNNRVVLLAHALDYIYGGAPIVDGHLDWLGKDLNALHNHPDMSVYEGRLLKIYSNAISDVWQYIDEDLGKIPEDMEVSDELKFYYSDDYLDALNEIEGCSDVNNISDSTKNIISILLSMKIDSIVSMLDSDMPELKYYHLYYFRALACISDENYGLYTDILESIDV